LAYDALKSETGILTIALDASHPNDSKEIVRLGMEYVWNNMFAVRGGYKYEPDLFEDKLNGHEGLAFGFGALLPFGNQHVNIDYAGEDLGRLSLIHRVSIGFGF